MSDLKIKVRACRGHPIPSQSDLLKAVNEAVPSIIINNLAQTRDGILLTLQERTDIYKLLSKDVQTKLRLQHLEAVSPAWLSSARALFAPKMSEAITGVSSQELVKGLKDENPGMGLVDAIILPNKFNDSRALKAIKLIFDSPEKAEATLASGFKVFNVSIRPEALQKHKDGEVSKLTQCYKCFKFDHFTNRCPRDDGICSICSGEHNFRDCPNPNNPKCPNCKGGHIAISKDCQIRQRHLKTQLEQSKTDIQPKKKPQPPPTLQGTYTEDFPQLPEAPPAPPQQCSGCIYGPIILRLAELQADGEVVKALKVREAANGYLVSAGFAPIPSPQLPHRMGRRKRNKAKKPQVTPITEESEDNEDESSGPTPSKRSKPVAELTSDSEEDGVGGLGPAPIPPSLPPIIKQQSNAFPEPKVRTCQQPTIETTTSPLAIDNSNTDSNYIEYSQDVITPGQRPRENAPASSNMGAETNDTQFEDVFEESDTSEHSSEDSETPQADKVTPQSENRQGINTQIISEIQSRKQQISSNSVRVRTRSTSKQSSIQ